MPLPRDWSPSRKNPIRPPPGHLEVLRASDRELGALRLEDIKPADITYDNAGKPAYFRTDICKSVDLECRAYFDSSRPSSPPPDPHLTPPAPIKRISVLHNGKPETNKRPIRMCWNHDLRKINIPDAIWDGHKIAWSFTEHSTFDEILHVTKHPKAERDDARLDPTIQGEGHAEISGPWLEKVQYYLHFPGLPVGKMQTGKSVEIVYPLEFLTIKGLQPYPHMLDGMQTKQMIQFCATKPPQRLADVKLAKKFLRHDEDPTLKSHGMVVGPDMIKTNARLLPNPQLQFANKMINPGVNGRVPLRSWGVGYLADNRNSVTLEQTKRWLDMMVNIYKMHGGKIQARPIIVRLDGDIGIACKVLYDETAKKNGEPQLLFVMVPNMVEVVYTRIKKSVDCRFGVPSQVLQAAQCIANWPQYHTNVLMKVNAKLGGVTDRTVSSRPGTSLRPMGMIIGADVTHPAPGVWTPSLAAMSVSADAHDTRYMGNCKTNGNKNNEIIGYHEIADILILLFREWIKTTGGGKPPKFIYYFRDGVSHSEYHGILNSEIPAIKRALALAANITSWEGKILPENQIQDSNGNPLPGTLIDRDVCSPHNWNFFLYSHIVLQGTARPVHYHVLADEMNHKADELEGMIYEHSYQYCRSSTSVSIHPAIYYAHLIFIRARHHEDVSHTTAGPQSGRSLARNRPMPEHIKNQNVQVLLPIEGGRNRLATKMWYV
ncbi:hypothetical protein NUU61_004707 [Penicillium alfredii]|uniref:Piwi domain-containing protein n=1 Tax=Penicillium alfredii TaxID=1506179 RepID=A0A9W9F881_9EURO|nr:uncharacterized protein NUU61_004707 [Penicillium alfredii]KAJ5095351.1 hypothetical protein NUU61_004707 [Penicillium alfredii]